MQDNALSRNIDHLLDALHLCRSKGFYIPALLLAYVGIDILASLDSQARGTTKTRFISWVDCYLLPNANLPCSAIDLYAARCAVVHTFGPESDLATKGKARRLVYALGESSAKKIEVAISVIGMPGHDIAIHVNSILDACEHSVSVFCKAILNDSDLKKRVEKNARFFSGITYGHDSCFLDIRMG